MSYFCEICRSIDQLQPEAWTNIVLADDLFMDPRFVRAVERSTEETVKTWSVIVRDNAGQPVAAACLSLLPIDLAMLAGGIVKSVGLSLRSVFPKALRYHALVCGLPVSAGQSHLRIMPTANVAATLQSLTSSMTTLAQTRGARFLVFKELSDDDTARFQPLTSLGFYRAASPPMNHFPTRFSTFAEYRAALKAPYRSKIVRSEKKLADDSLRLEVVRSGAEIASRFTGDVHGMYIAVVEKSPLRLEVLSADWFREMAKAFDRESVWLAVYQGERLLAWAYGLLAHGEYHSLFGGVDYDRNAETDAYFNLMYHELDFALRQGVRDIQLGQTADDFKSRLGATQSQRWFFVKPLRWKAKAVLAAAADWVLPKYLPPVERHVFRVQ